jgi:hypothetical protein
MTDWRLVHELLGPGLNWEKPRETFLRAIELATNRGELATADAIRCALELRDEVAFD